VVARLIVAAFPSIDALEQASREELEAVEGVGPRIAESIVRVQAARQSGPHRKISSGRGNLERRGYAH